MITVNIFVLLLFFENTDITKTLNKLTKKRKRKHNINTIRNEDRNRDTFTVAIKSIIGLEQK